MTDDVEFDPGWYPPRRERHGECHGKESARLLRGGCHTDTVTGSSVLFEYQIANFPRIDPNIGWLSGFCNRFR